MKDWGERTLTQYWLPYTLFSVSGESPEPGMDRVLSEIPHVCPINNPDSCFRSVSFYIKVCVQIFIKGSSGLQLRWKHDARKNLHSNSKTTNFPSYSVKFVYWIVLWSLELYLSSLVEHGLMKREVVLTY